MKAKKILYKITLKNEFAPSAASRAFRRFRKFENLTASYIFGDTEKFYFSRAGDFPASNNFTILRQHDLFHNKKLNNNSIMKNRSLYRISRATK